MHVPSNQEIIVYGAGKTWAAQVLRELRDNHGVNINSRWIELDGVLTGPEDNFPEEAHTNTEFLREIWDNGCKQDCNNSDMMILIANPEDEAMHSGSLVELGIVSGNDKPVYILGTCESFEPVGHSDRAWKSQVCVYYWPQYVNDQIRGAMKALDHYREHYAAQWYNRRVRDRAAAAYRQASHG